MSTKINLLLFLCILAFFNTKAHSFPVFKNCVAENGTVDVDCNSKALSAFEKLVLQKSYPDILANDSVYVLFTISPTHEVVVKEAFSTSNKLLQKSFQYLGGIRQSLQPTNDTVAEYQWTYTVPLQENLNSFALISNGQNIPKLVLSSEDTSVTGSWLNGHQEYAYSLVLTRIQKILKEAGINQKFIGSIFFEAGRPKFIRVLKYTLDASQNDLIVNTIFSTLERLQKLEEDEMYENFKVPFNFHPSGLEGETLSITEVDYVPVWPGCEGYLNNQVVSKECFFKTVQTYVNQYMPDIQGVEVKGRTLVQFTIEKDGGVSNVEVIKGVDSVLSAAAIKVISEMPSMLPAVHNGQAVRVSHVVPIGIWACSPVLDSIEARKDTNRLWDSVAQDSFINQTIRSVFIKYQHYFNDSIYFSYEIDAKGRVHLIKDFFLNSEKVKDDCLKALRAVAVYLPDEKKQKHYSISFVFRLPERFEYFQDVELVNRPLVLRSCSSYNLKAQRACTRYLDKLVNLYIDTKELKGPLKARVFFEVGDIAAIEFIEPNIQKGYNDQIYSTLKEVLEEYVLSKPSMGSDNLRLDIVLTNPQDSVETYEFRKNQLAYAAGLKNKESFFKLMIQFANQYYRSKGKVDFIENEINKIYREGIAHFKVGNRDYSMDSIRSFQSTNISRTARVPVYEGCNENESREQIITCFQTKTLTHISENLIVPPEAYQSGIGGKVYVNFVVNSEGEVGSIDVLKPVSPLLAFAVIGCASTLPEMKAAKIDDRSVDMSFTVPVNINIQH